MLNGATQHRIHISGWGNSWNPWWFILIPGVIIISVALKTGESQWRVTNIISTALFVFVFDFVTCAICLFPCLCLCHLCHLPLPLPPVFGFSLSSTLSPALFVFAFVFDFVFNFVTCAICLCLCLCDCLRLFVFAFVTCAICLCLCHLPLPLSSTLSPALFVFAGLGSVSMLNVSLSSESFFSFEICQLPCLPQFTTFLRRVCI